MIVQGIIRLQVQGYVVPGNSAEKLFDRSNTLDRILVHEHLASRNPSVEHRPKLIY